MKDDEREAFQLTVEVMAKCIAEQQKEIDRLNGKDTIRVSQDTILKLICDVQKLKHEHEIREKPLFCNNPGQIPLSCYHNCDGINCIYWRRP